MDAFKIFWLHLRGVIRLVTKNFVWFEIMRDIRDDNKLCEEHRLYRRGYAHLTPDCSDMSSASRSKEMEITL